MSQLPPAHQSPQDPNAAIPVSEPGFEVHVQDYWAKNSGLILGGLALVVVAIIGWQGWQYFQASREQDIRAEYAKVGDQTAKLASFASEHSGHTLAGVARLRLADERYAAADYKQAATLYTQAAESLDNDVLLGRAKLGAAISQINGGDQAAGEASLKAASTDSKLAPGARAEATYHLATIALDAGKTDEAKKLADEVSKIEATGPWAQRATMLIASLPGAAKPATAGAGFKLGN
ncbi:tetratricopeptide repeat protein [Oleiharenicola lentus]|uniref:tetratricopeptide repeat protein n=1 Tax=Oleiharenicola lentus TaxID=2508720 RepID=UPI003F67151E